MEVQLNKRYPLAVSSDQAWAVLTDIRAVAGCMPGAQITDQVDATHYKGLVRSKVGPALMSFTGDIEVLGLDAAQRRLELLGKGADKGGSSAAMKLLATLEPGADAASSVLVGEATVTVSGKLAQFGGRLLVPIADAMLAQFAVNFQATAQAAVFAPEPAPIEATTAATTESTTASILPDATVSADPPPVVQAPVTAPRPIPVTTTVPMAAAPSNDLNALGLMWIVARSWFLGLFGKKAS